VPLLQRRDGQVPGRGFGKGRRALAPPSAPTLPTAKAPAALNTQKMRVDVGARIMWSEDRQAIKKDMLAQGSPERSVDMALDDAEKDRRVHLRRRA
jgi:hypothetical protein